MWYNVTVKKSEPISKGRYVMDNRRKHSKRVFAMLLALIMCLSQAVTAAADEVSANETVSEESAVPEVTAEENEEAAEAVPEETVSEEAAPEEAVSGEAAPVEAEPEEAAGDVSNPSDFEYRENDNGITITGLKQGVSATGSLVIPGEIDGKTVTAIGRNAFDDCSGFTGSLTIPDSVTTIGSAAFANCFGFTGSLTIPDNVTTIEGGAFNCCSGFTGSLTIPNSVTSIGIFAFDGCYNISRITNHSAVSMLVKWFWNEYDTTTKCFKDAYGNKITNRETGEFTTGVYQRKFDIPLEAVSLNKANLYLAINESETLSVNVTPETTIYDEVTWTSSDPGVATVSNGVVTAKNRGEAVITATTVSGGLKATCNVAVNLYGDLYYVVSGNEVIITGHKDGPSATGSIDIPDKIGGKPVTVISNNAFKSYTGLNGTLTIGSHVKIIGDNAFFCCNNLTGGLTIPDTVTYIGEHAFDGLQYLTGDLIIPGSVKTIGKQAFDGCWDFDGNLKIGEGVSTIGNSAFSGCRSLSGDLIIPDSVTTIGEYAFNGCYGLSGNLTIGDGVKTIGKYAFKGCNFKGNLKIGKGLTIIGPNTFSNLDFHGSLTIPDNVTTIGESAFEQCTGFDGALTIGNKVETISNNAFKNCYGFKGPLTIGKNVKTIGESAFEQCTGFDGALTIGNKVETISNNAFNGCYGFTGSLTIPGSVVTIGESAFDSCYGFTGNLTIGNSVKTISNYAFYGCTKFTGLTIGNSVKTIGEYAFEYCSGLCGNLTIPNSVKTIGTCAFYECTGLSGNLTIPDSVTQIGMAAFFKCTGLSGNLTIPDSVTQIEYNAFDNCFNFSRIINHSAVSMAAKWFWDENDTTTKCFKDASGNEIRDRESGEFSTGIYERKVNTLTGVSLNKTSLEITLGAAPTLEAILSPSNTYWDEVSWNSSDKTVATVSNGVVTGLKPGNTVITVTTVSGGLSANCTVTVKNIPVTGVTLDKSSLSMYPGETETLTATVTPAEASQAVKWFSSNEKVATVDNGKVTSVSPGSATITVSTNDGGFKATCAVKVFTKATAHKVTFLTDDGKPYATQTIENGKQATDPGSPSKSGYIFIGWSDGTSIWNFTTPVNKDLTLIAKYKAEQAVVSENTGSGMDPTPVVDEPEKKGEKTAYKLYLVKGQTFAAGGKGWTTSDKTIANVAKNNGKITAKSNGTATVTNDTTEYTVYVAAPAVSKNSKSVTILVGQSAEVGIDLQAVDGTADKYPITWYSANPKVAVVNGGMVTGVAKGSTKVTAYIGGKAYSATVKVLDMYKAPAKFTENKAEFSMNPLQSFTVKFDTGVFTMKNAEWTGDGMKEVKNKSGKVTGYENKVINITTSGKFTAIGPGTTTVTGKDDSSRTVTVTVTVVPVSTKGMAYITKGKTDTIKFPKVTNKKADWWKSSNEKAATVDTSKKDGKVKGIDYGTSDISCLYKGFTFNTPVYVEDPGMVFGGKEVKNKDKLEMKVGEMKQLKINKTYQTLNFKSSKQANAFVDENGFVYARKKGKANISTKINGTTYQIAITVIE